MPSEPGHRPFLLTALLLGVAVLWILPITSSLWLDEAGTYWVIKDDLGAVIDRASRFHGQTPLYYMVAWAAKAVGGSSEVVLRAPSLLAMGIAVFLLYRLGRRLFDEEAAILATVVFATSSTVLFAATDARPYAIATAVLLGSTLMLVRWLDERRTRDGVIYVLLASATVYVHYLFAPALAAHAVYAWRRRGRINRRTLTFVCAGIGLLLLPALPQFLSLVGRRASLSVPMVELAKGLFDTIAPAALFAGTMIGLLVARAFGPVSVTHWTPRRGSLALAAASLLIVPIVFFLVSQYTPTKIFAQRYMTSAAPGLSLLAGWGIASVTPARARRIVVVAVLACATLLSGGSHHYVEGWREAIAMTNAVVDRRDTPVLVHAGFIESAQPDWLTHPERASYLMAPIAFYPIEGRPIPMPYVLNESAKAYLETIIVDTLLGQDRFLLITRYDSIPFKAWLEGRLTEERFRARTAGRFSNVAVYEFRRTARSTDTVE